jgi:hypothetical protein
LLTAVFAILSSLSLSYGYSRIVWPVRQSPLDLRGGPRLTEHLSHLTMSSRQMRSYLGGCTCLHNGGRTESRSAPLRTN